MGFKPKFWSATDIGTQRDKNEDASLWLGPEHTDGRGWLWLVCDGMGGASAGELASSVVCQVVREIYPASLAASNNPHQALRESFDAANRRLLYMQRERSALHKMGTTAVALAFYEGQVWIASVGDSRVYVFSDGKLRQLTTDQTKLQRLLQAGVVRVEDSLNHPSGNVLISALGRSSWEVDTLGDRRFDPREASFLLCSDGLSSFVSVSQLEQALDELSPYEATHALIERARETSNDNITATVVHFHERPARTSYQAFVGAQGRPLAPQHSELPPQTSFDFNPKDIWTEYQTGAVPVLAGIAADQELAGPAQDPSPLPERETAPRGGVTGKGGIALNTVARQTIADYSASPEVDDDLPPPSSKTGRWIAAVALVCACLAAIWWWTRPAPIPAVDDVAVAELPDEEPALVDEGPEAPTEHNEPLTGVGEVRFDPMPRGEFMWPARARVPDAVHSADKMPAYRIANGRMMIDAHEVTVEQFQNVLARSAELKELHYEIDEPRYRNLPCSTGSLDASRDPREPVCVSPESASVYCATVGRRLAARGDWRAMTPADQPLVATGYGAITRYGSDGPPPPVPQDIQGIYGVWDGLPESLHASPLDLARGDVATLGASLGAAEPIIVDARLSARFLRDGIDELARPMLGFRCVADVEKTRRVATPPRDEAAVGAINRIHPVRPRLEGSGARTDDGASNSAADVLGSER